MFVVTWLLRKIWIWQFNPVPPDVHNLFQLFVLFNLTLDILSRGSKY